MSDIRFNQWLHNSGTGGISQDSAGHVGIGTTVPTHINALTNNNSILHVGIVSCNTLNAASKIEGSIDDWIIHQDDTNTKFGFPAADTITAETAGAERLRIASDGKVGIGTVDPATIFHIHSSVPRITMSDSGTNAHHRINADSSVGNLGFEVDYASATSTPAFVVNIKGSEKLRITSAGNIGIGTDNPQVKLTVSSTSPAVCDIHHIDGGTNDEARIILGALAANPPSNRGAGIAAVNNGAGHDLIIKCSASHSAGPTEKLRIHSNGDITVPSGSIKLSQSGQGINFHNFGSGTDIDSNLFDDYEEGSWTPVASRYTGGAISCSYNSRDGHYIKIGRMVYVQFNMNIASVSSQGSNINYIDGLPFEPDTAYRASGTALWNNAIAVDHISAFMVHNDFGGCIYFSQATQTTAILNVDWVAGYVNGSITYITSA